MITININKAKNIAHDIRRTIRSAEFLPLDETISKQIPGSDFSLIEAERQVIRDKFQIMQENINLATTPDEIKAAIS